MSIWREKYQIFSVDKKCTKYQWKYVNVIVGLKLILGSSSVRNAKISLGWTKLIFFMSKNYPARNKKKPTYFWGGWGWKMKIYHYLLGLKFYPVIYREMPPKNYQWMEGGLGFMPKYDPYDKYGKLILDMPLTIVPSYLCYQISDI